MKMQVLCKRPSVYFTYYASWAKTLAAQSDLDPPKIRFNSVLHIAGFLAALLALFAISHVVTECSGMRFCQPWRMPDMQKVRYFQANIRHPEIVYLGTSQMHDGVMPGIVEEVSGKHGFNLAVPGANLEISYVLARDLLHGDQCPRTVVLGVFPVILDTNNRNALDFYCRYASLRDVAVSVLDGEVSPSALASSSMRGLENLLQAPFAPCKKVEPRYMPEYLAMGCGGTWLPGHSDQKITVSRHEWNARQAKFSLDTTANTEAVVFNDASRPARTLLRFQELAKQRGFRLIVVQPPQALHQPHTAARFQRWMSEYCLKHGIEYYDYQCSTDFETSDFADPLHLNAHGASKFSRVLGERLREPNNSPEIRSLASKATD